MVAEGTLFGEGHALHASPHDHPPRLMKHLSATPSREAQSACMNAPQQAHMAPGAACPV